MKTKQTPKQTTPAALSSSDLLARIREGIKSSDPNVNEDDESYKAAAVLLAAINVGQNQSKIVKLLGYPRALVAKFAYNLKKSGVWKNGKTYAEWNDPENGGIAFWMDVCVAQGLMERAR